VVSGQSSRVEEKNDNHCDGQEEKTSQKEPGLDDFVNLSSSNCEMCSNMAPPAPPPPIDSALFHSKSQASQMSSRKLKPFGKESGQEVKQGGPPDQYSSGLPRPQEHFSSSHDYGAQQDRVTDEEIKKELEDAAKTQIIAIQKIKNGKTSRTNFGQSFIQYQGSVTGWVFELNFWQVAARVLDAAPKNNTPLLSVYGRALLLCVRYEIKRTVPKSSNMAKLVDRLFWILVWQRRRYNLISLLPY